MHLNYDYHIVRLPHEGEQYAIFLAKDAGGNVRAVAKVSPFGTGPNFRPFVSGVHVEIAHRRKGIARGLMDFIGEQCRRKGNETLALYVHKDNIEAEALYRSLGFTAFVDDGVDILHAVKLSEMQEVS